ncbi:MAG TPA: PPC domain-containing DNA-binding protein [Anaerolineae bacterium]
MESATLNVSRIHILRIDPGEDVLDTVKDFLKKTGLEQAIVMGGCGTLAAHSLHWVTHNRITTENAFARGEGGIEILGMSGMVVEGQPHIHVTLSTQQGAYGGHMEQGCKAYVICEIFFAQVEGKKLTRERVPVEVPGMGNGTVSRLVFN